MPGKEVKQYTAFERFANRYENNNPLMPFFAIGLSAVGLGVVDRLFCKVAADYTVKRIENLMIETEKRVDKKLNDPASEAFMSALYQCLPGVLETQSEEKVRMFAAILAGTWNDADPSWDQVAQSLRLVRQLEDVHIFILRKALELSPLEEVVVTFSIGGNGYPSSVALEDLLPNIEPMFIASCVSDLIAMGLINDFFETGNTATFDSQRDTTPREAPQGYAISRLGRWLLERISEGFNPPPSSV